MIRVIAKRIHALALALGCVYAYGQMREGTEVFDFQLPLFNEEGYRVWQLRGDKGVYASETQIRIEGMTVNQYTGDEADRRIAELTSPEAIFHFDSTTAYGPGELRVGTNAFEVSGQDWIWLGEEKQITFNRDVRVVLYEGIGDILK